MPLTPDEERRLRAVETLAAANKSHLQEIQSRLDRDIDGKQHAWTSMLDGAKRVLTSAFAGELDKLKPQFDQVSQTLAINKAQNSTLEEMRSELAAARDERVSRKAIEVATADAAYAAAARRRHRFKVVAILSPFLLVVVGALVTAIVSQINAQHAPPAAAPASPH